MSPRNAVALGVTAFGLIIAGAAVTIIALVRLPRDTDAWPFVAGAVLLIVGIVCAVCVNPNVLVRSALPPSVPAANWHRVAVVFGLLALAATVVALLYPSLNILYPVAIVAALICGCSIYALLRP